MLASLNNQSAVCFKNAGAAAFLEENVMLNKALLDASVDVPFVVFSNNKIERKERLRRVSVNYSLCFLSPFLTLPLTNRLAMKYVGKLTKSLWSNNHKALHISNRFLNNTDSMMQELNRMSKKTNKDPFDILFNKIASNKKKEQILNIDELLKSCDGDKEKLRKKLIAAKNSVLSFDFLFSIGSICGMAFLNNKLTKDKTKTSGYSAEFELADKETIEKRAEKYQKKEPLRKGITAGLVAAMTAFPLIINRGLASQKTTGLAGFIKNNAHKFDYTNGIFMKRLPLFMFLTAGMTGVALASRNQTELKNNLIINGSGLAVYFGGDILINSALAKLSDKFLKTEIIDKNAPKTLKNKILPPTIPIRNLEGKSKKVASVNFFINLVILALTYGLGLPYTINKVVRKDLQKDKEKV